jgi:hypothetical protein
LRVEKLAYGRTLVDCRERLRAKRAWVRECERKVRQAKAAMGQAVS